MNFGAAALAAIAGPLLVFGGFLVINIMVACLLVPVLFLGSRAIAGGRPEPMTGSGASLTEPVLDRSTDQAWVFVLIAVEETVARISTKRRSGTAVSCDHRGLGIHLRGPDAQPIRTLCGWCLPAGAVAGALARCPLAVVVLGAVPVVGSRCLGGGLGLHGDTRTLALALAATASGTRWPLAVPGSAVTRRAAV